MSAEALTVYVVAPVGRDAELLCHHLEAAGVRCHVCADLDEVCGKLNHSGEVGALLFTEEALTPDRMRSLAAALDKQPAWSEIPLMILAGLPELEAKSRAFPELGRRTKVTIIDRPVRIKSLVSTAQAVLRARQRQYELRDLMEKLEDRVHERDRFLAILGHELRNPLGAILLASQMIEPDGRLDGAHAQLIERQSRHLTRIVNDLLDLSRVVSGKIVLKPQVTDLRRIAHQALEIVSQSAQAQGVTITCRECDQPVRASVDPVRIEQIITNILTNAIKYTPEGGQIVVSIEAERDDAVIRVKDNGVGIAADRIGRIFELFAQAENAIGRSQGGMGVGLALVRNLIELHGGSVNAYSDGIGKGSEFIVRLPLAEAEHHVDEPARVETTHEDDVPRHIVIVEDNVDVRELLRLKLRRLGHAVDAVGDGESGIRTIVNGKPDLALVDIGLPGMDGYQVAAHVRETIGDDVVLVAVSGFGQPEDKRRALEAGFDEHITKPADVGEIEGILRRFPPRNSQPAPSVS